MSGTSHPETIRVVGRMKNKDVIVFIDGGSTHNFIDHSTTTKLALPIVSDKTFQVMVGNGEQIECKGRSLGLILVIQGCLITTDFYILPVAACQVVLGMDYQQLTMNFQHQGQTHIFQGLHYSELEPLETKELLQLTDLGYFLQVEVAAQAEAVTTPNTQDFWAL
ncbi:hypothetical protein ACOSP7_031739 [Xanthoceras sorbifolium]